MPIIFTCVSDSQSVQHHSPRSSLHVFLEMISIPGGAATTKCAAFSNFSLYWQLGKKSEATNRFIAQAAFSILLSIDYSPQLTNQSVFALFRTTRHKGKDRDYYHLVVQARNIMVSTSWVTQNALWRLFAASCLDQGARGLRGRPIFILLVLHSVHQDVL